MNKAYERINWENYPSEKTPLNEDNLNKIDVALDEVDNRVVAQETTKLDKATANTMVKDVTFDETTGIFTITFLNGVTKTLDTKLEKIATNFRYDYATQKLILTLVDGTTQEIDMKALITQYEFENSAYISWTITSDGKIKADIINGSITADKLQPNFLADVTLQANNAKTSEQNAKTSEENAKQSEINAKNYADSAEPVASTVSGLNPTLPNSTAAPIISMQIDGATEQQTYSGKNLVDFEDFTLTANESSNNIYKAFTDTSKIEKNKTYNVSFYTDFTGNITTKFTNYNATALGVEINAIPVNGRYSKTFTTADDLTNFDTFLIYAGSAGATAGNTVKVWDIQIEEGNTATDYEPYVGGTASPNPDYPHEIHGVGESGSLAVKSTGKNLLKNTANSQTKVGVTATMNSDGSITLNGSATEWGFINLNYIDNNTNALPNGTYILSGGTSKSILNVFANGSSLGKNSGAEIEFTIADTTNNWCRVEFNVGSSFTNETIYPMIRPASVADDTWEPYVETTANIPPSAPLYEGDYIRYNMDGSGEESHKIKEVDMGSLNWEYDDTYKRFTTSISDKSMNYGTRRDHNLRCDRYTTIADGRSFESVPNYSVFNSDALNLNVCVIDHTYTNATEFKNAVQGSKLVYELATPTVTPLTAEQIAEFKKLYSFDGVTNVMCEGETEIDYFRDNVNGRTVAMVVKMVKTTN